MEFEERNIFSDPLNSDEIREILSLTELGTEEIISTRSKIYEKLNIDFDKLSTNELIALIEKYPGLLRRPIILDSLRLQVGYNEDEIHQFIPREIRRTAAKEMARMLVFMELEKKSLA
ncbi:spx/MgsR family transcriptional regulator [Enterococcus pallens]|nr:spx/MgsR family transcriptional regulator [Enterococcus pallens]